MVSLTSVRQQKYQGNDIKNQYTSCSSIHYKGQFPHQLMTQTSDPIIKEQGNDITTTQTSDRIMEQGNDIEVKRGKTQKILRTKSPIQVIVLYKAA